MILLKSELLDKFCEVASNGDEWRAMVFIDPSEKPPVHLLQEVDVVPGVIVVISAVIRIDIGKCVPDAHDLSRDIDKIIDEIPAR